jgi:hypothetical protein
MPIYNGWTILNPPSYPPCPCSIEWGASDLAGAVTNPFTGQMQVQSWGAGFREISVSYQPLNNSQALAMAAWLESLQGMTNIFQLGDPLNQAPQNPLATAPTVSGANQTGFSLVTTGGNGLLQAGDWIQLGYYIYRITFVNSGTYSIWPNLRVSPANGASIIITGTQGIWRLKDNSRKWTVQKNKLYTFTFEAREAI